MPLYEYKCESCGDVFEVLQRFSDEPVAVHEKCGGPVHKLISRSALQFKGTGWYITDYARSGAKPEANGSEKSDKPASKTDSKTDSASESKAESKSDSKTESKTESKSDTSSSSTTTTESATKS